MSLSSMLENSTMEEILEGVFDETQEGNLVSWRKVQKRLLELNGEVEIPRGWGRTFDKITTKVNSEGSKAPWGWSFRKSSGAEDLSQPRTAKQPLKKVTRQQGVAWGPGLLLPDPARESWYGEDASLRRLALASTGCFANWSDSDQTCGSCPLARWCQEATFAKMEEVARELDAIPLQPEPSSELEDSPSPDSPSPDSPSPDSPSPDSPSQDVLGVLLSRGVIARRIPNPFRSVCSGCGGECVSEDVIHISSGAHRGVFHDACAMGVF